ncbi:MAG: DUF4846 domain-containing protein [Bacteroidales bacterium]|nr:DUF4846 domain-containing protein [Bacteroidales bacterium]
MILKKVLVCFTCVIFCATSSIAQEKYSKYVVPEAFSVASRYPNKVGSFYRRQSSNGTFEYYVQNLPLKPANYKTHFSNGEEKVFDVQIGVLDLPQIKERYQQSSGYIIQIRSDYLYNSRLYGRIHYNFINGFVCSYAKWAAGFRVNSSNNGWEHFEEQDYSRATYKKYMDVILQNTNCSTLAREMSKIKLADVKPGDVFIQNGHPGHAVLIVDVLYSEEEKAVKLVLAQGFSPAQDMEILKNFEDDECPWFTISVDSEDDTMIRTPQWTFYVKDLRRFAN